MKTTVSFFFYLSLNFLFLFGVILAACNDQSGNKRENYDLNDPLNKNEPIPATPPETNTTQPIHDSMIYDSPPSPSMKKQSPSIDNR